METTKQQYWHITSPSGQYVAEVINGEQGATSEIEAIIYHVTTSMAYDEAVGDLPSNIVAILTHLYTIGALSYKVTLR